MLEIWFYIVEIYGKVKENIIKEPACEDQENELGILVIYSEFLTNEEWDCREKRN